MPYSSDLPGQDLRLKKTGFTLTELFVSVLILFMVAILVMPLFSKERYRSHSPSSSNQKQIALAFLQYIQDYDEQFPPAIGYVRPDSDKSSTSNPPDLYAQSWGPDRTLPDGRVIPGIISPYVKSTYLFLDSKSAETNKSKRVLEYMYNDLLVHQKLKEITDVSETVLTIDAENRLANAGHALTLDSGPYSAVFNSRGGCDAGQGASIRAARFRHFDGANVSFTDGHVRWFKGGSADAIFFPPRESASVSSIDPVTGRHIGPTPGLDMAFQGRRYTGTFHVR